MNNLPDTIQWLIDFANLGCKPGELNPSRLYELPKVKRPPVEPPSIKPTHQDKPPIMLTGARYDAWLRIYNREKESTDIIDDKDGCVWQKKPNEPFPIFIGKKEKFYPPLIAFKKFFLERGIPPKKLDEVVEFKKISITDKIYENLLFLREDKDGKNILVNGKPLTKRLLLVKETELEAYEDLKRYMNVVSASFFHMIQFETKIFTELKYAYESCTKESGKPDIPTGKVKFKPDNTLPCAIYAYIFDLWFNHKELHSYLRQCKCCGLFWVIQEDRKRGRNRMFCSEACKRVFHQQSRSDNQKAVKTKRTRQKEKKQKEDYSQLIEFLLKNDYTQKEAEKESFEWVSKKGKSFKEFKRTRAVSYGLK